MEGSGEIIVDEKLKAIDKRTGRYINVIARTIDNGTSFPIVKYLDKNRKELNYDCVRHLNFDIDIDWELRRYQIVKDLLSNDFDGRRLSVDEVALVYRKGDNYYTNMECDVEYKTSLPDEYEHVYP